MASITGEKHPILPTEVNAPAVAAMDAKLMVTTWCGHSQKLKAPLTEMDATNVASSSTNQASRAQPSFPAIMHPLLLQAASKGDLKELGYLLNREETQAQPDMMPSQEFLELLKAYTSGCCSNGSSGLQRPAADVEEGAIVEAPSASLLLKGVTVQGDTALHVVAANGEDQNFMDCADLILRKDKDLLSKQNSKGDTPLHCAARAGTSQMVSHLIGPARGYNIVKELLRQGNTSNETVLHEAVRNGNDQLVKDLLAADPKLASFPQEGTSPLYLAVLLEANSIAQMLYDESENNVLSYSGPNGQNVLHAAVLRGAVLTKKVLEWNTSKELTTQRDANGSTPLHFAAGLLNEPRWRDPFRTFGTDWRESVCLTVFKANTAALYQPDNDGLFPIHVAASLHAKEAIIDKFVNECPSSAGLRDTKGRTFLHVAVEKNRVELVQYAARRNRSLAWILNMQNNDGNTALHLAVQAGSIRMFCSLFGNKQVKLSLPNVKGQTPLDIARYNIPPGLFYKQNSEVLINRALETANDRNCAFRGDYFLQNYENSYKLKSDYGMKELKQIKERTQTLCIGSVLIATVTFGATFALPGGYRADDHTNGGTPTLAGRYAFDAFMTANALAFSLSCIATVFLIRSGSPYINPSIRKFCSAVAFPLVDISVTCLVAAFALAVYSILGSVAHKTAIAVSVMGILVVVCNNAELWLKCFLLARPLYVRKGRIWALIYYPGGILAAIFWAFGPIIFIFLFASLLAWHHPTAKLEPSAPAPAPSS